MNLFKRHIARRVAAVGVGVGLLVLGLEAPAFAALGITSFSPTSGPAQSVTANSPGCVVVITGTDFKNPDVNEVDFTKTGDTFGTPTLKALDFILVSGTEIWATVPNTAITGPIGVKNTAAQTFVSSTAFTVTPGTTPDPCGPTITSFTPTCGVVGTVVTVNGTNLLKNSGDMDSPTANATQGGAVRFAPYAADATATGQPVSPTKLTVSVPADATDGPIKVTTFAGTGGTVTSTGTFNVVADPSECGVTPTTHARSVSLSLRKHLVARGKVSVGDGFTDCAASVPVKIQHRVSGRWKTVGSTTTTATGAYNKRIRDRAGKYRAKAPSVSLGTPVTDICSGATSPVRRVS
jgi:hypothetical protein